MAIKDENGKKIDRKYFKLTAPDPNLIAINSDQYRAEALKWIEIRKIAFKICKTVTILVPILATIVEAAELLLG